MKILTICPSKYLNKLEKMLDSFSITRSNNTNIIINYEEKSITNIFNEIFNKNPNYDFYFMANDDIIFETPLWDLELANKNKISFGRDMIQNENLCTFPMIDGDIVRAIGWLQMPNLNRYCGDLIWKFIGSECKCLNYKPSVIINHKWDESQIDISIHKEDQMEFSKWLQISYRDVNKVKEILNATKN